MSQFIRNSLVAPILIFASFFAQAQKFSEPSTKSHPDWSKPFPPFQIVGNLYYVGSYELACYLIATPKGNILINTGLASSAQMIKTSITKLGFKLADTKILLNTQAHYDHMGAMSIIKKLTGAKLMMDAGDVDMAEDGGSSNYASDDHISVYKPVSVDRVLHNKDVVELGGMHLVMLHHPGHTSGSCSYIFEVHDNKRNYRVLIANLPTIITKKKFSTITSYPNIAKDYVSTLNSLRHLKFDIWLASHAGQFGLIDKHRPESNYNPSAFIDQKGYDEEIDYLQKELDKKINNK